MAFSVFNLITVHSSLPMNLIPVDPLNLIPAYYLIPVDLLNIILTSFFLYCYYSHHIHVLINSFLHIPTYRISSLYTYESHPCTPMNLIPAYESHPCRLIKSYLYLIRTSSLLHSHHFHHLHILIISSLYTNRIRISSLYSYQIPSLPFNLIPILSILHSHHLHISIILSMHVNTGVSESSYPYT